jgi:hypothetical protein
VNSSPIRVDSDIESIPDEELFSEAWRLQVAKNNNKFYGSLNFLPLDELKRRTGKNAIEQRIIVIAGSPGSGKDAKTDTIVDRLFKEYKRVLCFFQEVSAENFHQLLDAPSWSRQPIQAIGLQDCTNVTFKEDPDIRDFWRIRHKMKEKTGISQGLVLLCLTCHSWFRFQKEFRTEPTSILISDMPMDEYDKREYCRRFIPDKLDQRRLERIGARKIREPAWKGFAYAVGIGFIYLPEVPEITPDRTYEGAPVIIPKPTPEPVSAPIQEPIQEPSTTGRLLRKAAVIGTSLVLGAGSLWLYLATRDWPVPSLVLVAISIVLFMSRGTLRE